MIRQLRRRWRLAVFGAALLVAGAVVVQAVALKNPSSLVVDDFSALTDPSTRIEGSPPVGQVLGGQYAPDPGTAHALGKGAIAWVKSGRICFATSFNAGCAGSLPQPIDVTVGDPDGVGVGAPGFVNGLAADDVVSVTAVLNDGRRVQVIPDRNFYTIALPAATPFWEVVRVVADRADGSSYSEPLSLPRAPG